MDMDMIRKDDMDSGLGAGQGCRGTPAFRVRISTWDAMPLKVAGSGSGTSPQHLLNYTPWVWVKWMKTSADRGRVRAGAFCSGYMSIANLNIPRRRGSM